MSVGASYSDSVVIGSSLVMSYSLPGRGIAIKAAL